MKHKETYLLRGTFALVIFVCLGYVVKFYPETLSAFDQTIQSGLRGRLPAGLTSFFKAITIFGNTSTQIGLVALAVVLFWLKQWKAESLLMLGNGLVTSLAIVGLKEVYQRPRPILPHLAEASGYSFPSGHALGAMVIFGSLFIIAWQRLPKSALKNGLLGLLATLIVLVGVSRIYLGVHYPSDVLAGFLVGYAILNLGFPTYDKWRFQLRFTSKQK